MNYVLGCEYKQRSCTCRGLNGKGVVDKKFGDNWSFAG